jgi:hypothetical protein
VFTQRETIMLQRRRRKGEETFIRALACGASVEAAAQKAGISRATAYRRMHDPELQRQLQEIRSEMVRRTSGGLTASGAEALKTLLSLMQPTVPPGTRLGAARSILEIGMKMREVVDLDEQVKALEERMPKEGPPP